MIPNDPNAEEAKRKSYLAAWRRVTEPISDPRNIEKWNLDYLDSVVGGYSW